MLQTADIVMYGQPGGELLVPVGEDQVSHVEISREIVRRFNLYYGLEVSSSLTGNEEDLEKVARGLGAHQTSPSGFANEAARIRLARDVRQFIHTVGFENAMEHIDPAVRKYFARRELLVGPEAKLTESPRIPGTDGRKMSKSYGNFISLGESNDSIRTKSRAMMTDPARKRRTDPGNPDVCPVYDWHKLFSPRETLTWAAEGCRSAGIGCIECKAAMADHLIQWIEPIRARREEFAAHPETVLRIVDEGSLRAREVARNTMDRVREAVFHWKQRREEVAHRTSTAQNAKVGD